MGTFLTACVSAGATTIVAILTWNHYMKKMAADVMEIKGQADNRRAEHEKLSGEHGDIRDKIMEVILEQQKQQSAREEAAKHIPQEQALLKMMEGVCLHSSQLVSEISQLKETVAQQQNQIAQQQKQIKKLKQRIRSKDPNWDEEAER